MLPLYEEVITSERIDKSPRLKLPEMQVESYREERGVSSIGQRTP